jgi:hypothetical protein
MASKAKPSVTHRTKRRFSGAESLGSTRMHTAIAAAAPTLAAGITPVSAPCPVAA